MQLCTFSMRFFIIAALLGISFCSRLKSSAKSKDNKNNTDDPFDFAVEIYNSTEGNILIDGNGFVLYQYSKDSNNTSRCYGPCIVKWPPVVLSALLTLSPKDPLKRKDFDFILRKDGLVQLCYNKKPLYYYILDLPDKKPKGKEKTFFYGNFEPVLAKEEN